MTESLATAADKRSAILGAALDLFEAHGFDGTAVPDIARQAGVGAGTIYRYYESKDALVNALYRLWKGAFNDAVFAPQPPGLSARDVFGAYWRRMAAFSAAHPKAARFLELHRHAPYLDPESRALAEAWRSEAAAFVAEAAAQGAIKPLAPALVVALMWGTLKGLLAFAADGDTPLDADLTAAAEACLWDAIRA